MTFELIRDAGLYSEIPVSLEDIGFIGYGRPKMEIYCHACRQESPFVKILPTPDEDSLNGQHSGLMFYQVIRQSMAPTCVVFRCLRCNDGTATRISYVLYFGITVKKKGTDEEEQQHIAIKIGQYPAYADLAKNGLNEYRQHFPEDHSELMKAIGLNSHDASVGAFVYLRRVIERLVDSASRSALKCDQLDEKTYQGAKMVERIKMLSGFLPDLMVKNARIYSILSKGIHELTEAECSTTFPVLLSAVELILQERKAEADKRKAAKRLTSELEKAQKAVSAGGAKQI